MFDKARRRFGRRIQKRKESMRLSPKEVTSNSKHLSTFLPDKIPQIVARYIPTSVIHNLVSSFELCRHTCIFEGQSNSVSNPTCTMNASTCTTDVEVDSIILDTMSIPSNTSMIKTKKLERTLIGIPDDSFGHDYCTLAITSLVVDQYSRT
ncbi:hypothetical protein B0T21DRAFT_344926 [Apiosordaria backusii]|uniref:Uncharacterized protein n=1 Tax=Apiosordaria backusii TaxID=314023 RepID=A0AA40K3Z4_9PEZI|nr:hypothetical protein B0T21DRAFT_344926 [Apiosordaria backusii]